MPPTCPGLSVSAHNTLSGISHVTAAELRTLLWAATCSGPWRQKKSLQMRVPRLQKQNTQHCILWICSKVKGYVQLSGGRVILQIFKLPCITFKNEVFRIHQRKDLQEKNLHLKRIMANKSCLGRGGGHLRKLGMLGKIKLHSGCQSQ